MAEQADYVLWAPDADRVRSSEYARFCSWLQESGRATPANVASYRELWQWSVDDVERFWRAFAEYAGIDLRPSETIPGAPTSMPGGEWFPGASVNYADVVLGRERDGEAIIALAEDGTRTVVTWLELRQQVGAVATFLRQHGVTRGDRVAAVLPNRVEAVVGLLAAAWVGAIWSVVAPEFGAEAIVARLQQLAPKVLITTTAYDYSGRVYDRGGVVAEVLAGLTTVEHVVWVGAASASVQTAAQAHAWPDVTANGEWSAEQLPFTTRFGCCSPQARQACPAVPRTRTGKKLEVPVKRLIQGAPLESVADPGALDNFAALAEIRDLVAGPAVTAAEGNWCR